MGSNSFSESRTASYVTVTMFPDQLMASQQWPPSCRNKSAAHKEVSGPAIWKTDNIVVFGPCTAESAVCFGESINIPGWSLSRSREYSYQRNILLWYYFRRIFIPGFSNWMMQGDFFRLISTNILETQKQKKINVPWNLFGVRGNLKKCVNQIKNTNFTPKLPLTQKWVMCTCRL